MHVIFRGSNTPGCSSFDGREACGSAPCASQTGMTAEGSSAAVWELRARACCAMSGGQRASTSGSNRRATNVRVEQQASLHSTTRSASSCSAAVPGTSAVTRCGKQRQYTLIQAEVTKVRTRDVGI